jgi:hypothetical protein
MNKKLKNLYMRLDIDPNLLRAIEVKLDQLATDGASNAAFVSIDDPVFTRALLLHPALIRQYEEQWVEQWRASVGLDDETLATQSSLSLQDVEALAKNALLHFARAALKSESGDLFASVSRSNEDVLRWINARFDAELVQYTGHAPLQVWGRVGDHHCYFRHRAGWCRVWMVASEDDLFYEDKAAWRYEYYYMPIGGMGQWLESEELLGLLFDALESYQRYIKGRHNADET